MRRHALLLGLLVLCVGPLAARPAAAQRSRCADCHIANPRAPGHVAVWDLSPHARADVGCDACHGGDATTFEAAWAHRGILPAAVPESPVNRRNIPVTCGNCHEGPFLEFRKSRHYELLERGNLDVPICSTCHGEVAADLLSPARLEARCLQCHGEKADNPQPQYARQARQMLEGVAEVRADLREAGRIIRRVKHERRRSELELTYRMAEAPLIDATHAGHAFVYDKLQQRLAESRRRTDALLDALANEPKR